MGTRWMAALRLAMGCALCACAGAAAPPAQTTGTPELPRQPIPRDLVAQVERASRVGAEIGFLGPREQARR